MELLLLLVLASILKHMDTAAALQTTSLFLVSILSAVFGTIKSLYWTPSPLNEQDPVHFTDPQTDLVLEDEEQDDAIEVAQHPAFWVWASDSFWSLIPDWALRETFYRSCAINLVVGALAAALIGDALAESRVVQLLSIMNLLWVPLVSYMLAENERKIDRDNIVKVVFYAVVSVVLFFPTVYLSVVEAPSASPSKGCTFPFEEVIDTSYLEWDYGNSISLSPGLSIIALGPSIVNAIYG